MDIIYYPYPTRKIWVISIPYPVELYPLRTGYYPKYLDRVGLDIHYPMGMAIPMYTIAVHINKIFFF